MKLLPPTEPTDRWYLDEYRQAVERQDVTRKALREYRTEKLEKETPMSDDKTYGEEILERVNLHARRVNYDRFGQQGFRGTTTEKVKAEYWATDEGRAIRALLHSPLAEKPATVAKAAVVKSGDWSDALAALEALRR